MATAAQWVQGARPRTLPAALAPVLAGTGCAMGLGRGASAGRALLALVVALALQVAVNYANDYSDGIRGTDDERVGPVRLTASGAVPPAQVKRAAFVAFGVAAVAGLLLVAVSGAWVLLPVGATAMLAAWFYTGGARPYGYLGLGEVFVFVFFGLVAVLGTTYTQSGRVSWAALGAAAAIGALACALLVVNNLRDRATDAVAGKRTLAVRLGDSGTRRLYQLLVAAALLLAVAVAVDRPGALLALLAAAAGWPAVRAVRAGASGLALLPALRDTARMELAYGVLLLVGVGLT